MTMTQPKAAAGTPLGSRSTRIVNRSNSDSGTLIEDLRVELTSGVNIVDEISLSIAVGSVTALVGESGSGKTTVGQACLGYTRYGGRIAGGRILVGGQDILAMSTEKRRAVRSGLVSYVPQDRKSVV